MLSLNNIKVVYSDVVLALSEVSITVNDGNVVVLLGSNGAGKSTTLKSISGVLQTEDGKVTEGTIKLDHRSINRLTPEQIANLGIYHVLQGRSIFPQLSTEENLLMGAYLRRDKMKIQKDLARIFDYFPKLVPLRHRKSGFLSGGEQQMLVTGRALMGRPKIILLDEPSLGLAPSIINNIFAILKQVNEEEKTSLLIAEQHVTAALAIADYVYVLQNGRIATSGSAESLRDQTLVKGAYLGLGQDGTFISRHNTSTSTDNDENNT